ncbi:uncharacterized protein LOC143849577 [Tasmannia lanceolata]|uniref:uncharacterized protein LOC143849577 n=1 Tax=Tasmannia lanceolata TaxID=3420 RepID=UPI00406449CC
MSKMELLLSPIVDKLVGNLKGVIKEIKLLWGVDEEIKKTLKHIIYHSSCASVTTRNTLPPKFVPLFNPKRRSSWRKRGRARFRKRDREPRNLTSEQRKKESDSVLRV